MDLILRVPAILEAMGFSPTTLWRQIRSGKFPLPVRISENGIGWFASEVEAKRASLARQTYDTTPAPQPEPPKR